MIKLIGDGKKQCDLIVWKDIQIYDILRNICRRVNEKKKKGNKKEKKRVHKRKNILKKAR